MGNVFAIEQNASAVGLDEADNHVKTGCFSGTVRTEKADHFAFSHLHAHIAHYLAAFVRLIDSVREQLPHDPTLYFGARVSVTALD
jgi:hypothetical protein